MTRACIQARETFFPMASALLVLIQNVRGKHGHVSWSRAMRKWFIALSNLEIEDGQYGVSTWKYSAKP